MIVDLGTGDGRAVLARAGCEPSALVIGVDASAPAMAESSRRADRRGPRNALFLAAGVEALPSSPLADTADLVTIVFPWGSLLRGALGVDRAALRGIVSVVTPGGRLEVVASVVSGDGVADLEELDEGRLPAIAEAWRLAGLQLTSMRPATAAELATSGSTWARRLGVGRRAWRLDGVRSG
ncbi:MAG TPA: class I SAM-dependent methyltransferase [Candidatus Limnocylindrales bacterium]|nr:class I SAM-dependent methyltransferase [Candidatus Limnocylindrales bacterium]